jgi:hypothetical protein
MMSLSFESASTFGRTRKIGVASCVAPRPSGSNWPDLKSGLNCPIRTICPEWTPDIVVGVKGYVRYLRPRGGCASSSAVEDRARADLYKTNAARHEILSISTDLTSYLRSLEMCAVFRPFDQIGRSRIAQLINKTNRFNLTTRRYTEADVLQFETSPSGLTLQIRLLDRFGDNGIVSVVICIERASTWIIDTWLMSCRVLNRKLEHATLNHIASCARSAGVSSCRRSDEIATISRFQSSIAFQYPSKSNISHVSVHWIDHKDDLCSM